MVVGAGVAGSTAALSAAHHHDDVMLVHRPAPRRPGHGETLPPQAKQVLLELGRWEEFEALRSRACWANRSAWGSGRLSTREHIRNPYGSAWHIERHRFEAMLRDCAVAAGVRLVPGHVRRVERRDPLTRLTLDDGSQVDTASVVDATGRSAAIARRLGARRVQHDRLVGLVWHHKADTDPSTLVETVPDGWWFSAPTAAGMVAVLFGDADLLDRGWASRRQPGLLEHAPHTRARLTKAGPAGEPTLVAASTSCLRPAAGPGWVAVGDAAATYDPLSSQGILHSLVTGREAATAIACDSTVTYEQKERDRFNEHLLQRRAQYRVERRWPAAGFWRRRNENVER